MGAALSSPVKIRRNDKLRKEVLEQYPTKLYDGEIMQALLSAYRKVGRIRLPMPALVAFAMRELKTNDSNYLEHFYAIHRIMRGNWGNKGVFHRKRGMDGGIALRKHVQL